MYRSLGADDTLPVVSTDDGRGGTTKSVSAFMGKTLVYYLQPPLRTVF